MAGTLAAIERGRGREGIGASFATREVISAEGPHYTPARAPRLLTGVSVCPADILPVMTSHLLISR
jgi:hypothetical protein